MQLKTSFKISSNIFKKSVFKKSVFFAIITLIIFILSLTSESKLTIAESIAGSLNPTQAKRDDGSAEKIIYLTFDDGPSYKVTDKLLAILKEKDVKATFFVVGQEIKGREDILKRIAESGNAIGLHTYSHNYKKIYKNNDAFLDEINRTRELVRDITGVDSTIIRFPWGSRNHLNKELLKSLHENDYKIYDWTTSIEDGVNPKMSPYNLYRRSISEKDTVILLMHCNYNNKNTCVALSDIIDYYKKQNYEFRCITPDTPELYFTIKK